MLSFPSLSSLTKRMALNNHDYQVYIGDNFSLLHILLGTKKSKKDPNKIKKDIVVTFLWPLVPAGGLVVLTYC